MLFSIKDREQLRLTQAKLAQMGESPDAFLLQEVVRKADLAYEQLRKEFFEAGFFRGISLDTELPLNVDQAFSDHLNGLDNGE